MFTSWLQDEAVQQLSHTRELSALGTSISRPVTQPAVLLPRTFESHTNFRTQCTHNHVRRASLEC
eukprot:1160543-Prorocentrum_minimum.AAC.2